MLCPCAHSTIVAADCVFAYLVLATLDFLESLVSNRTLQLVASIESSSGEPARHTSYSSSRDRHNARNSLHNHAQRATRIPNESFETQATAETEPMDAETKSLLTIVNEGIERHPALVKATAV